METRWRPIKEPHSIETVAAVVYFAEPLTGTLLKRALRAAERAADSIGLVNREQLTEFAVNLGPTGAPFPSQPQPPAGVQFQRRNVTEGMNGEPLTAIEQNFVVLRDSLQLIESSYIRWSSFYKDIQETFLPVLNNVLLGCRVKDVRLEYRDRFVYNGLPNEANARTLLNINSEYISRHIFDRYSPWHSHTGMLLDGELSDKVLTQILIETADRIDSPHSAAMPQRSVSIVTGIQHVNIHGDLDVEQTAEEVLSHFQPLHEASKALFKNLITDEIAERISLSPNGVEHGS